MDTLTVEFFLPARKVSFKAIYNNTEYECIKAFPEMHSGLWLNTAKVVAEELYKNKNLKIIAIIPRKPQARVFIEIIKKLLNEMITRDVDNITIKLFDKKVS